MLCTQHWVNTLWHLSKAAIQSHISGCIQRHLWYWVQFEEEEKKTEKGFFRLLWSQNSQYGAQFTILLLQYTYFSTCVLSENSTCVTLCTSGPLPALLLFLDRWLEVPFWPLALGVWDFTTELKFAQSENINFCVELAWLSCRRSLLVMRAVYQDTKQEFQVKKSSLSKAWRQCMRSGVQPGARLLLEFVPQGLTVSVKCYCKAPRRWRVDIWSKRPDLWLPGSDQKIAAALEMVKRTTTT